MKTSTILLSVTLLLSSASAFASENSTKCPPVVSASGATSLTQLEGILASKAKEAGAKDFKIISAGGNNKFYGVAEIYR